MKSTIKYLIMAAVSLLCVFGCEDLRLGDAGLSRAPETDGATVDSLFSSLKDADKVLLTAYSYLPFNFIAGNENKLGVNVLEALTDLFQSYNNNISDGPRNLYYSGALSSALTGTNVGIEAYRFGSENDYRAIRYGWLFIENAHLIPDGTPDEVAIKVAEAKMCIAIAYFNMLRYVGGVPILDHAVDPNEDMAFPRATFSETVEFIVRMIDEAAPALPWQWDSAEDGRMTKAGALALKLRVLCYAASPTLNSDPPYRPDATEYQCYMNYDAGRWQRAKEAAEEFMREHDRWGYYGLVQPTEDTHEARRLAYQSGYYDRGTPETLISIRKSYQGSISSSWLDVSYRRSSSVTLNYVCMYPWADGTDFISDPDNPYEFDWANPPKQPFFEADGTPTRDPRLYENIAVPGDLYVNGTYAPVFVNNVEYPLGGSTGFFAMKYRLREDSDRSGRPVHWAYIRYPEVLLNAAEAINEADGGPNAEAYEYVNQVRARVGLSPLPEDMTKEEFRKALIRERCLEFGFEEIRWFDMVRWGLVSDFTKPLYGLRTVGDDDFTPTSFTFEEITEVPARAWAQNWDTKWYFAPIPRTEIDKDYGMTQNPGW